MSDNAIRHLIASCGFLVSLIIFWVGYASAGLGWWWTAIVLLAVYGIIYKLVQV